MYLIQSTIVKYSYWYYTSHLVVFKDRIHCQCEQNIVSSTFSISLTNQGWEISPQSGLDFPKMGQIRDILDHMSVDFGSVSENVLKYDQKMSSICPTWYQSDPLLAEIRHP